MRTLALLLGIPSLLAQVPVGAAISGAIGDSSVPLLIVGRTPPARVISNTTLTNINALRIDPVDGRLWMATTANGQLRRGTIAGTQMVSDTLVATLPAQLGAMAFDLDGNSVVGGGVISSNGGVWSVHRHTGAITTLVDSVSGLSGIVNAVDEDSVTGDIYFGTYGTGNVYRISPPYALNSQVLVGTISGIVNNNISGLCHARTSQAPLGALFVSAFASAGNASLSYMDPATGVVTLVPGTPGWYDINALDYDAVADDLWLVGTFATRAISTATLAGANVMVHQIPDGAPAAVEVNAIDTSRADVRVFPQHVPVPAAPITFEAAALGAPGELGVVAIVAPVFVLLGSGPVRADGRFSVSIPGVVMRSGTPAVIQIQAATVNPQSLALKLSSQLSWPRN